MRLIVDKQLSEVRSWLRSKTNLGPNKTANDRQKLLITVMQEVQLSYVVEAVIFL